VPSLSALETRTWTTHAMPSGSSMQFTMCSFGQDYQILRSVIIFDSIDMMYFISGSKWSINRFCYYAMFINGISVFVVTCYYILLLVKVFYGWRIWVHNILFFFVIAAWGCVLSFGFISVIQHGHCSSGRLEINGLQPRNNIVNINGIFNCNKPIILTTILDSTQRNNQILYWTCLSVALND
jgi:hypothetical protein